ncbi:cadmium-translocating P-type ATPase [Candidatus Poribacteria bacterium]|nr:MAG: cadmium-translocating P-type ATPase [Candidatus Poribacteria bacterium]
MSRACCDEHGHDHPEGGDRLREIIELGVSGLLFGLSFAFGSASPFLLIPASLIARYRMVIAAGRSVAKLKPFDENVLVTVATVGAMAIKEVHEAAAVMILFRAGELLEEIAVERSRRSIKSLLEIKPESATVLLEGGRAEVRPAQEVKVGEVVLVKPGERVPLDGEVIEGESGLDLSALTGESVPVRVRAGDKVFSGSVNLTGALKVRVSRPFSESVVSRILRLVEEAAQRKSGAERFIARFARVYTPAVVGGAVLTALLPPLLGFGSFQMWVYRSLVFLMISCPCALVLSVPLTAFAGLGAAARKGILIKGSGFLEALCRVEAVVFDKTGTLTLGVFDLQKITPLNGFSEKDTLRYAAIAEKLSDHPIALAITRAWGGETPEVQHFEEIAGKGVKAVSNGSTFLAGNQKMLDDLGIEHECREVGTVVHVVKDGVLVGEIVVGDRVKSDVKEAIDRLRAMGVRRIYMLTGDKREVAQRIGGELGLDGVFAELMPDEKVDKLEEIKSRHGKVAFVGDGINDAPAIMRADVGIAMGGMGRDAAIEAADVVIATDEPSKVVTAIQIARKTRRITWQNVWFALSVKAIVLGLGFLGMATIWEAVFADVGVALLTVLNSLRAMR